MAAYHVVFISSRIVLKLIESTPYNSLSWFKIILDPIFANFLIVPPIILIILVVSKYMIDRGFSWLSLIIIHFFLSLFYLFSTMGLRFVFDFLFYEIEFSANTSKEYLIRTITGSNLQFLGYLGFVAIIHSYYYFQKKNQTELQSMQLAKQLQEVKMNALKSQLNPHFLFNTLNSISALIREDSYKAQQVLGNLGDLLREVLVTKDKNLITVNEEMIILEKYLEIMKTRFSDHLSIASKIEDKVRNALMPSMLLQPILENSLEHGYSKEVSVLHISITVSRAKEWVIIRIENNGAPISKGSKSNGLGIQNVKDRLVTLYGDMFFFSFRNSTKGKGVRTEIRIPYKLI